jgi:ERAP1-like C-terminal domain
MWPVPLQLNATNGDVPVLLASRNMLMNRSIGPYSIRNPGRTGFYLVKYPADDLVRMVLEGLFSAGEISDIIGDTAALALASQCSTTTFLNLLKAAKFDNDFWYALPAEFHNAPINRVILFRLWSQAPQSLSRIQSIFADDEAITAGLAKFIIGLTGPTLKKIGWINGENDGIPAIQLRALLLATAGCSNDPK